MYGWFDVDTFEACVYLRISSALHCGYIQKVVGDKLIFFFLYRIGKIVPKWICRMFMQFKALKFKQKGRGRGLDKEVVLFIECFRLYMCLHISILFIIELWQMEIISMGKFFFRQKGYFSYVTLDDTDSQLFLIYIETHRFC